MLGAVGCVIVGGVFFGVCGGGISIILFGVAAALVGVIVAALGGYAVAVPMAIVVLILTLPGRTSLHTRAADSDRSGPG